VALQSSYGTSGEHWRTIGLARVDGDGRFAILHSFRTPGEVSLRAVTHPKGATLGASQPLTYEITQAQNTALTIETSKDPIIFGQSLTISGAAAGPAPQQVTLFAHAPGHPFAAVASASTGEGGSYAFSVSPRTSTAYQVRTATESSTVLFEGLRYRLTQDAAPASVAALTPLTLSGTLVPAPAGQRVLLEQQNGSGRGFHVLATGLTDSLGHFTVTYVFARPGSYVLRIKVPAGPSSQAGFGAPFTIAVVGGAPAEASEAGEEPTGSEPGQAADSGEAAEPAG
jgi:hypothetical protein